LGVTAAPATARTPALQVLYRDDRLVAIAKPCGLVVHRSEQAHDSVNCMGLLRRQVGQFLFPVHRLDRGASGVLVFALDREASRGLSVAFAEGRIEKHYLAVVRGFVPEQGRIDSPITDPGAREPQPAETRYTRVATAELPHAAGPHPTARYSLVHAEPRHGRTHQLRRHFAHIRHPIVGDVNHGDGHHNRLFRRLFESRRLLLHASRLQLPHPATGAPLVIEAPLPDELRRLFEALGWPAPFGSPSVSA
jgi:tRNA pseudouridine65 synthase